MAPGTWSRRAAVALTVLAVLAAPAALLSHEHGEKSETQCRTCQVVGTEAAISAQRVLLPPTPVSSGLSPQAVELRVPAPVAPRGAPRAPPT